LFKKSLILYDKVLSVHTHSRALRCARSATMGTGPSTRERSDLPDRTARDPTLVERGELSGLDNPYPHLRQFVLSLDPPIGVG
jgi:hypothetical protein